jgi:hypothetical protein
VRFLKYFSASLALFVALVFMGLATAKVLDPSRVGVWVGPHMSFAIGAITSDPRNVELLGDAFAPLFGIMGYLLGCFSWERLRELNRTRPAIAVRHLAVHTSA